MTRIERFKQHFKNLAPKAHEISTSILGVVSIINKKVFKGKMDGAPAVRTAFSIVTVALAIIDIKENISSFKGLKNRAKVISIANIITNIGSITEVGRQLMRFTAEMAKKGASNIASLSVIGTVLGVFSVAIQALSITVESIELRSLFKQSKKFKLAAAEGKQSEYLVEKADKAKGLRAMFNPISENQTKRISSIFQNAEDVTLPHS